MKKLIAMIGAVAMAFGLFAEIPEPPYTPYSTSFETADPGVNDKTWTPPLDWTTTQTEAFTLGDQLPKAQLPYATGRDRRDGLFLGEDTNVNFLKLETGTNTLSHGIDVGQVYFDQLVKFTGYEEDPEIAADAKIAVWLSAIDADDQANPVEEGSTNLFVTVGTGTAKKNVKIAGDFEVDKWYRVTIKSIDDVSEDEETSQLGFQLFIDGQAASIVEADRSYNSNFESFNDKAAALYAKGQLFTAIKMNDLALATVAYQGIGGVDDIIFSKDAPDFDSFVEIASISAAPNGVVTKVVDKNGKDYDFTQAMTVPAGDITVTVKPAAGIIFYKDGVRVATLDKTVAATAGEMTIELDEEDFGEAVAKVNDYYCEDENETLAKIAEYEHAGTVEVEILVDEFTAESGDTTAIFNKGTKISIEKGGIWTVDGDAIYFGDIGDGSFAKDVSVSGELYFSGTIKAGSSVVAATVVAEADPGEDPIEILLEQDASITTATDIKDVVKLAEGVPSTYKLKTKPAEEDMTTWYVAQDSGFMVIIAGQDPQYFETLQEAVNAAPAGATIQLLKDAELSACVTIAKEVVLDLNGFTLGTVAGSKAAGVLAVNHGGFLTVEDSSEDKTGMIDGSALATAIKMTAAGDTDDTELAKLVVNGGMIIGGNYGIGGNGNAGRGNTYVEINGGAVLATVENDSCAIFNPQKGDVVINDGLIEGGMAIIIKSGKLTVNGGKIKAVGVAAAWVKSGNGFNNTGDAIEVDNIGYPGESPVVEIKGGTIESVNNAAIASQCDGAYEQIANFVTGGTFTGNAPMDNALAGGSYAFPPFTPGEKQTLVEAIAKIGDVNYPTLAAAVAAAETTDTVTLIKDITLAATLNITKAITLDLNKKTVTLAADLAKGIAAADVAGAITITNGKFAVAEGRANIANSMAFDLLRTSAVFTDVEIDVPGFEYVLSHMGNIGTNKKPYWTVTAPYTIDCNNVDIKGNGSLFHIEYAIADLDSNCTATQYTDKGYFANDAHKAAIYSSCGAKVTVNGGYYKAVNALQTGNLGGDIIVKKGVFDGNIKSWMLDNDTRDFADVNKAKITIEDGVFTGDFVYAANCSAESPLLTVEISDGDFSDKNIPVKFIAPEEHKVAKWVDSTLAGYVTPGYDLVQVKAIWVVDDVATTNLVDYNTVPVKPEDPVKANYEFTGWQPTPGAAITEDTTYTAQFKAVEYKYSFVKAGAEVGDPIADITYTVETAETLTAPACTWTLEGYEFAGWTNTVNGGAIIAAGATLEKVLENTELTAAWNQKQQGWDVPSGDEDKPASEVWETIPNDLADVPAGRISTWAKANSVPFGGEFTDTMKDAYLLNCDPNDSAKIAEEKAKVNIASIEFVNGEWVVTTVGGKVETQEFGNGKLVLEDVTESITGAAGSDAAKLWKMKLVPITAAE